MEVNSFIKNVINLNKRPHSYVDYRNIEVLYATNYISAKKIVDYYINNKNINLLHIRLLCM